MVRAGLHVSKWEHCLQCRRMLQQLYPCEGTVSGNHSWSASGWILIMIYMILVLSLVPVAAFAYIILESLEP